MLPTTMVIFWIILCNIFSLFFKHLIIKDIKGKPIVSLTVIDLCYADCISLLFLFEIFFSVGIILCLISNDLTLNFELSLTLTMLIYFALMNCFSILTITGALRLITLVSNSEQYGIQSFGPDYIAVWKIRLMSFSFVVSLMLYCIMFHQSIPAFLYDLYHSYRISSLEIIKQDPFSVIYPMPIAMAFTVNTIAKIYNIVIKKQIFGPAEDKFALSLGNVLIFPLLIILLKLLQFEDRYKCLVLLYPVVLMLSSVAFPLAIILKHKQMKKALVDFCVYKIAFCKPRSNHVSP